MLPRVTSRSSPPAQMPVSGTHRIAGWLERWLVRFDQRSVSRDRLRSRLEKSTFGLDRRDTSRRGLVFRRLLEKTVAGPVTAAGVVHDHDC